MGYEVHITRADEHFDSDDHPIDLAEWITYAEAHPSLSDDGWIGWDEDRVPVFGYTCTDGTKVSMTWCEGGIDVKGIRNQQGALELLGIATDLQANLIGDDGEHYTARGVIRRP